jgi:hypothetical protein
MVVNYAIKPMMIHPCAIHVPILDMSHPAVAYHLQGNQKVAHMLMINIAEARNLQQADGGLAGASDPYAVMVHSGAGTFGARYLRTQTVQVRPPHTLSAPPPLLSAAGDFVAATTRGRRAHTNKGLRCM